jgi:hypothetical protein
MGNVIRIVFVGFTLAAVALLLLSGLVGARDLDGARANADPIMHAWFDKLASQKGLCCSFADGVSISDVDWDTGGPDNQYRVRINDQWVVVPDEAIVTEGNRFGPAVVWPYRDNSGATQIRCFMPGAGT